MVQHSFPLCRLKTGKKSPQKSSSRPWLHPAASTYPKVPLKRHSKAGRLFPAASLARIQLSGRDLTYKHLFYLLSGLLRQTLSLRIYHKGGFLSISFQKICPGSFNFSFGGKFLSNSSVSAWDTQ